MVAAVAAKKWNRAVKIRPDRDQDMTATGKRHDFVIDYDVSFDDTGKIEAAIDHYNEDLPPLKEFVLPGGSRQAASCHLARAVCRRAERNILNLDEKDKLNRQSLKYINRLSDLLFVAARVIARDSGAGEILWQRDRA